MLARMLRQTLESFELSPASGPFGVTADGPNEKEILERDLAINYVPCLLLSSIVVQIVPVKWLSHSLASRMVGRLDYATLYCLRRMRLYWPKL
jgi:hypothetical protein